MVTCHGDMSRHVYCTHQFTHESEKHDQTCARPKHELAGVIKRWPVPPRLSKSRPHDAEHPWHGHLPPRVHFDRVLHQLTVALFLVVSQVRRLSVQEIGCATEDEPLRDPLRSRRMITARDTASTGSCGLASGSNGCHAADVVPQRRAARVGTRRGRRHATALPTVGPEHPRCARHLSAERAEAAHTHAHGRSGSAMAGARGRARLRHGASRRGRTCTNSPRQQRQCRRLLFHRHFSAGALTVSAVYSY